MQNPQFQIENHSFSLVGKMLQRSFYNKPKKKMQKIESDSDNDNDEQNHSVNDIQELKEQFLLDEAAPAIELQKGTIPFTYLSREAKCNFRFPNKVQHNLKYSPNYKFVQRRSPAWTISKAEKQQHKCIIEYEVCKKNPICKQISKDQLFQRDEISTFYDTISNRISVKRSIPDQSNSFQVDEKMRYSIVLPREKSRINKFFKSKIKQSYYMSPPSLLKKQIQLEKIFKKRDFKPISISFKKQLGKSVNINRQTANTEAHFNNSKFEQGDTKKTHNFSHYSPHETFQAKISPHYDLLAIKLEKIKENKFNANLNFSKFTDQIKTRYDRFDIQPNVLLDYNYSFEKQGHVPRLKTVYMHKTIKRNSQLFPSTNKNVRRACDKQTTDELKRRVKTQCSKGIYI